MNYKKGLTIRLVGSDSAVFYEKDIQSITRGLAFNWLYVRTTEGFSFFNMRHVVGVSMSKEMYERKFSASSDK